MRFRTFTVLILAAIMVVALFGLPSTATHMGHGAGCPLMPGEVLLCSDALREHLGHWQSTFAAIAAVLFVVGYGHLATRREIFKLPDRGHLGMKHIFAEVLRPTLFEELFSQGILNRNAP